MDLPFTHVYEWARCKMQISRDEYALCNYVATWAAYPGSSRIGWCDRTLKQKADFVGITPRGLTKMQNGMIDLGLIEKDILTSHVRTTIAWWETINEAKDREQSSRKDWEQSSHKQGTKFPKTGEQSSHDDGNKVPTHNKSVLVSENNDGIEIKPVDVVVDFLNQCLKPARPFSSTTKKTVESINARLKEKYTAADLCLVVEHKCVQWKGNSRMEPYLRPATLFGQEKFEGYLVDASNWQRAGKKNAPPPKSGTTSFGNDAAKFETPQLF